MVTRLWAASLAANNLNKQQDDKETEQKLADIAFYIVEQAYKDSFTLHCYSFSGSVGNWDVSDLYGRQAHRSETPHPDLGPSIRMRS